MKILVVEDDSLMQATLKAVFTQEQVTGVTAMDQALEVLQKETFSVCFLDINLTKDNKGEGISLLRKIRERDHYLPCVMISGMSDKETITKCLELGAVDYVVKGQGSPDAYKLALIKALMWRKMLTESSSMRVESREPYEILGESPAILQLRERIKKVAKLDGPFLILGETGTGKELVSRALWSAYQDNNRPFIALNCASLPENLVESELFGYERGAFTGALTTKAGLFEAANGGDIFLDEIGELTVELQAKLLRVLQEKRVRRLGSDKERPVNFRVIAATHVDLLNAVSDGDFREDLFYRINVHQIHVAPLRDRKRDVSKLLAVFAQDQGMPPLKFEPEAQMLLETYSWPGNVRQLRAFAQYLAPYLDYHHPVITKELVENWLKMNDVRRKGTMLAGGLDPAGEVRMAFANKTSINLVEKLDGLQKAYVQSALTITENNRSQAAKLLGVSRQRLSNWLNEWGL